MTAVDGVDGVEMAGDEIALGESIGLVTRAPARPADAPMPVYTLAAEPATPATPAVSAVFATVPLAEPEASSSAPLVPRAVVTVKIAESKADAVEGRELFQRYFRNPLEWRAVQLPDRPPEPTGDPQAAVEALWAALLSLKKAADENGRRVGERVELALGLG